nr:E3 ubiquitin-protein ligase RNF170-like isoform X3 [Ziziphus jujuba var. spinosa]
MKKKKKKKRKTKQEREGFCLDRSARKMGTDGPPENDCCTVCHDDFNVPCQANCSHWFCGNCIMLVWQHGSALQPCKCPLCRRQITLLVPSETSVRQRDNHDVAEVLRKIETYNRMFSGHSCSIIQRMQDLPFLLRRLWRELLDPRRSLPLFIRARVYIAVK